MKTAVFQIMVKNLIRNQIQTLKATLDYFQRRLIQQMVEAKKVEKIKELPTLMKMKISQWETIWQRM